MRTMGNFDKPDRRQHHEPKRCRHCHRPVSETIGDTGYCKKCIDEARPKGGTK